MILAVLYILVMIVLIGWPSSLYLFRQLRGLPLRGVDEVRIAACFLAATALSISTWLVAMRSGVRALQELDRK